MTTLCPAYVALIDAAHRLVPMPVGQAFGHGPALPAMDLVTVLSPPGDARENPVARRLSEQVA